MWDNVQNDLLTSINFAKYFLYLPPMYVVSVATYVLYFKQNNVISYVL